MQWQTIAKECVSPYMEEYSSIPQRKNFLINRIQSCNVHWHLRGFEFEAVIYLTGNYFIHFTTISDREAVLDNSCTRF